MSGFTGNTAKELVDALHSIIYELKENHNIDVESIMVDEERMTKMAKKRRLTNEKDDDIIAPNRYQVLEEMENDQEDLQENKKEITRMSQIIRDEKEAKKRRALKREQERQSAKNKNQPKEDEDAKKAEKKKTERPPPIILKKANEAEKVQKMAKEAGIKFEGKMSQEGLKIFTKEVEDFRSLKAKLEIGEVEHHTYQLRSEKELRVVIKGIPTSYKEEEILKELKSQEVAAIAVKRMTSKGKEIDMVMVKAEKTPEGKRIFNVEKVLDMRVKVEAKRKSGSAVQCFRCQEFGHVSYRCSKKTRCYKCGEEHEGKNCQEKIRKCANCGGEHSSAWKECPANPDKIKEDRYKAQQEMAEKAEIRKGVSFAKIMGGDKKKEEKEEKKEEKKEDLREIVRQIIREELSTTIRDILREELRQFNGSRKL